MLVKSGEVTVDCEFLINPTKSNLEKWQLGNSSMKSLSDIPRTVFFLTTGASANKFEELSHTGEAVKPYQFPDPGKLKAVGTNRHIAKIPPKMYAVD